MTRTPFLCSVLSMAAAQPALGQTNISPTDKRSWSENCGWMNWRDAGSPAGAQGAQLHSTFFSGFVWCENIGWINLGGGAPANGAAYANSTGADFGVNLDPADMHLFGLAWGENVGWINFAGGAIAAGGPAAARFDASASRLRGYAWGENIGWINLDDPANFVGVTSRCGSADFDCDGDTGTDADIEAFFACIAGSCPAAPCSSTADFNDDGDVGTDADIEAFFSVLAGGSC